MSVFISKDKKELIVTCNCKCGQSFSICIDDNDDDFYCFLCFLKCNFNTEHDMNPWRAFKIKMKKIWFIIRGKDYCYSDTLMTKAEYEEFKKYVNQF